MKQPNDPNAVADDAYDDDDGSRSYTHDYVLLDRTTDDDPVWLLTRVQKVRAAELDLNGQPTAADQLDVLCWSTESLMRVVNPRPIPGGGYTFRLELGDE